MFCWSLDDLQDRPSQFPRGGTTTTRHGEEDLVDDGWIGSSQLDMTMREPEQPTPNSYATRAPCPQPQAQALRNELHCTTLPLHCTALRRDAMWCNAPAIASD